MSSILYKITLLLLCSLMPIIQSCKQYGGKETDRRQLDHQIKRDQAIRPIIAMLNNKDFKRALLCIDSLHKEYPNDPQLYFCEGWVCDMQNDSLQARDAFTKSMVIYDSLIAAKPNFNDMINRAVIVQRLYGMEAYNHALDEIQSTISDPKDSLVIEQLWRNQVWNFKEISFL